MKIQLKTPIIGRAIIQWMVVLLPLAFLCACGQKANSKMPKENAVVEDDPSLRYLARPVTETAIGYFQTVEPQTLAPADTLNVEGFIDFDPRALNMVNTRVAGRVNRLFVKYAGQQIEAGQKLMEIYSPELAAAQRDLLQAVNNNEAALITELRNRLINLGMTEAEINGVIQSHKINLNITIFSSYTGIAQSPQMAGMNMEEDKNNTQLPLKEGQYIQRGEPVLAILNTNRKWAILHIPNQDLMSVKTGAPVQLFTEANSQRIVNAHIDFVPPFRNGEEQTAPVRVYLSNLPGGWKIGTLIRGKIALQPNQKALYVPRSAVNMLGPGHSIVWVRDAKENNVFEAREVETGEQRGEFIQVRSGISPDEKIARNASFMVDNDSYIK